VTFRRSVSDRHVGLGLFERGSLELESEPEWRGTEREVRSLARSGLPPLVEKTAWPALNGLCSNAENEISRALQWYQNDISTM
jgi:hypothetical protein